MLALDIDAIEVALMRRFVGRARKRFAGSPVIRVEPTRKLVLWHREVQQITRRNVMASSIVGHGNLSSTLARRRTPIRPNAV
jgi:hypothetical protein